MVRLVVADNGELRVSPTGAGRGGYLHVPACCQIFLKKKSVYKAFHIEVSKTAKEKLIRELNGLYRARE